MGYFKAVFTAIAAALLLGAGAGAIRMVTEAFARMSPGDKATVLAWSISEAINCTVFFVLVLVPLATVAVILRRRWRRRPATSPN